jgi:outer membrane protein
VKPVIVGVVAAAVLSGSAIARAQVSEERVAEILREARVLAGARQGPAGDGLGRQAAPPPGLDLTVDEAVVRALEQNLDIAVERLNPQAIDLSIAALEGVYRPVLTSTVGQNNVVALPTSQLVGGTQVRQDTSTYNAGLNQALQRTGGNVLVAWNNRRQKSTNAFNTFNPQFNSTFSLLYNQPLLRGFRIDLTRQQLAVTRINREISEIQLRAIVTNTLANVRNAYWDLVASYQAVEVARRSLDLADKLVEDNRVRVEVGTLAPIDIVQAEAEAASRRQLLAQAEATWQTAELALKRLIVSGTEDPLWSSTIVPIDRPRIEPVAIDLTGAVRTALTQRTDLDQARRQLESSNVSLRFLHGQTLPGVDLSASYGLQGIGGTRVVRSGGLGGEVSSTIPGGYLDALRLIRDRDFPTWNLQVQVSYPLGQSSADASYARGKVQLRQSQAQLRALELQVATEVTNAALLVQSNLKRVEAARAARDLAQRRLEAEESKFEVGMSTNFFVVQAQRDLFDAQITELRSQLDHQKSLVDFERVQQTAGRSTSIAVVAQ